MNYRADGHELSDPAGRLLLGGPVPEIAAFAAWLSAHPPGGEAALRAALMGLIACTTDCCFAPFVPLSEEDAADLDEARDEIAARRREEEARRVQMDLFAGGCL
jgi:hypothetical protein